MTCLLIPVAPLSRSKSRLSDCFSQEQLVDFTIAMFKDLCKTLENINCFEEKIVYCNSNEILNIAEENGIIAVKEKEIRNQQSFNDVIQDINALAVNEFNAKKTLISFLDLILITSNNFLEINSLLEKNQLVICPAIRSAGISVIGRNPPDIIPPTFSDPTLPSLIALYKEAKIRGIKRISFYDSFRASFDVDVKEDCLLAYHYLKLFNLKHTETYSFLKKNLKITLKRTTNNREFLID